MYHVPEAKANIISIGTMIRRGWEAKLSGADAYIHRSGPNIPLVATGTTWRATLRCDMMPTPSAMITAPIVGRSPIEEEHQRLGHLRRDKVLAVARQGGSPYGVEELEQDGFRITACSHCQTYKVGRPPKNQEAPRGLYDGHTLHVDLGGPFEASSVGMDTVLVAVDDHSKARFVVPMKIKSMPCSWLDKH